MATSAHETSPTEGDTHHAAVRLPPADPNDRQAIVGPATRACPSRDVPVRRPTSDTSAVLACSADAAGQGWFERHVPSLSLAATPARRTREPSAHQTGPSPSQTRVGGQRKVAPAGITVAAASSAMKGKRYLQRLVYRVTSAMNCPYGSGKAENLRHPWTAPVVMQTHPSGHYERRSRPFYLRSSRQKICPAASYALTIRVLSRNTIVYRHFRYLVRKRRKTRGNLRRLSAATASRGRLCERTRYFYRAWFRQSLP